MTIRFVEFCAGAGGTRSGLQAAGWSCIGAYDNDPGAVAVHRLAVEHCDEIDVRELTPSDLPDADVYVAGFPCQPFSTSGPRAGFEHRRGNVFQEILRLVSVRRPPFLLLENVEGLLVNKAGHTFAAILRELTTLNYDVDWLT